MLSLQRDQVFTGPRGRLRFHAFTVLSPHGSLALIYRKTLPMPWESEIRKILAQFSDRQGHRGSNAIKELEVRGFFRRQGEQETAPIPFVQSLDDYIQGLHSRSSFSRERMGQQRAADFDQQVQIPLRVFRMASFGRYYKYAITISNKHQGSYARSTCFGSCGCQQN